MSISPKRLREMEGIPEDTIDTSDIPELDHSFWLNAKMVKPQTKELISLPVDRDVLDWFQSQGQDYQTLMNSVLRSYVEQELKAQESP